MLQNTESRDHEDFSAEKKRESRVPQYIPQQLCNYRYRAGQRTEPPVGIADKAAKRTKGIQIIHLNPPCVQD